MRFKRQARQKSPNPIRGAIRRQNQREKQHLAQPAKPRHRARSVKFGDHPRYCLDPHREIVWRCNPAARWGSGTGSVRPAPSPARRAKLVTFLRLTHPQDPPVPCLENPRVDGSIPSQATNMKSPLCHRSGLFSLGHRRIGPGRFGRGSVAGSAGANRLPRPNVS